MCVWYTEPTRISNGASKTDIVVDKVLCVCVCGGCLHACVCVVYRADLYTVLGL